MEINQTTLKQFRQDFQDAVKSLEEKYGIVIQAKSITYSSNEFHFKVEVVNGESKEDEDARRDTFNQYCSSYGLTRDDFMRIFDTGVAKYQIVGINPNRRKYPIIIKNVATNGEGMCSIAFIRPFIKEQEEATGPTHKCKYCGQETEGDDKDLLCPECREAFGHTFYSEL